MVKKIVLVLLLLGIGVAIAMYLRGATGGARPEQAFTPRAGASEADRIADLEKTLAAQVDRANLLESRLAELEARVGARGTRRGPDLANADSSDSRVQRFEQMRQQFTDANGNFDPTRLAAFRRQQELERLVQAGFTQERSEAIERRVQELQLQAQQAQYDAQRTGQPYSGTDIAATLRREMGDGEYEKYLTAIGRPTQVQVVDVLASSAAEKAGLKPGDQIVSYAGQRVFDNSDLTALTRQGTPGETVNVEVQRDGQTMTVQVPRGVLGVQAGGGGRRGGFTGGPPGGFGGFGARGPGGGSGPGG
jgi:hypothetical protein